MTLGVAAELAALHRRLPMLVKAPRRPGVVATRPQPTDPVGINVAAGAVLVIAVAFVAAGIPPSHPVWRSAALLVAVAGFAAATVDKVAAASTAGIGLAVFYGFLVNRLGELSWHGTADLWRLMATVVAVALGLVAGEMIRHPPAVTPRLPAPRPTFAFEKEIHRG
jgi:MFS family permease